MLADDEPQVRSILCHFLEIAGYRVTTVADGQAAVDACYEHRPTLAVLDYRMPKLDGLGAGERLRGVTPFIIVSGDPVERAARAAGARGFCAKPVDYETLLTLVREAIGDTTAP